MRVVKFAILFYVLDMAAEVESVADSWTFLSNYAHVILFFAQHPDARMREAAAAIGITERAVQRIVSELDAAGALSITRQGRRNRYELNRSFRLRHPLESHRTVGDLISLLGR